MTATYEGDANFAPAAGALTQVVWVPTTAALSCQPNPSSFGDAVLITAEVSGSGAGVPSGSVVLSAGDTVVASLALDSRGQVSTSSTALAPGTAALVATYQGDGYFAPSSAAVLQRVDRATTTIEIRPVLPSAGDEGLAAHAQS